MLEQPVVYRSLDQAHHAAAHRRAVLNPCHMNKGASSRSHGLLAQRAVKQLPVLDEHPCVTGRYVL